MIGMGMGPLGELRGERHAVAWPTPGENCGGLWSATPAGQGLMIQLARLIHVMHLTQLIHFIHLNHLIHMIHLAFLLDLIDSFHALDSINSFHLNHLIRMI